MTSLSNAARATTLERALRAGVQGDRATITEIYADDVRTWTPGYSTSSVTELITEIDRRDDAFSDFEIDVMPLDVGGDFAGAEWRVTMTHTGKLVVRDGAVIDPTGLRVHLNGVTIAEFRDDRICSLRQYWDELTVFEQLGLLNGGGRA